MNQGVATIAELSRRFFHLGTRDPIELSATIHFEISQQIILCKRYCIRQSGGRIFGLVVMSRSQCRLLSLSGTTKCQCQDPKMHQYRMNAPKPCTSINTELTSKKAQFKNGSITNRMPQLLYHTCTTYRFRLNVLACNIPYQLSRQLVKEKRN